MFSRSPFPSYAEGVPASRQAPAQVKRYRPQGAQVTTHARSMLSGCHGKRRLHAGVHRVDARVRGARGGDQGLTDDVRDVDKAVVGGFAIGAAGDGFIPILEVMAPNGVWQRGQLFGVVAEAGATFGRARPIFGSD